MASVITQKRIVLHDLDATLGRRGLNSRGELDTTKPKTIYTDADSPVTEAELQAAVDAHVYVPPTPPEPEWLAPLNDVLAQLATVQTTPGPQGPPGPASTVPGPKGDMGAASTVPGPAGPASTVPGPPGPGSQLTRTTVDQAIAVVALTAVTGMSFPVVAGTLYRYRFDVIFRTAALTTGIGIGLTYPAATSAAASVRIPFAADGAASTWHGALTSSGDSVLSTGVPVINSDHHAVVEGTVLPSANGTVQLTARSEIAGSAATVRNGSSLTLQSA